MKKKTKNTWCHVETFPVYEVRDGVNVLSKTWHGLKYFYDGNKCVHKAKGKKK